MLAAWLTVEQLQVKKADASSAQPVDESPTALLDLLQSLQEQVACLQNEVCELKVERDCLKEYIASSSSPFSVDQVSCLRQNIFEQQRKMGLHRHSKQQMPTSSQMHRPHLASGVTDMHPPISMPMAGRAAPALHTMPVCLPKDEMPQYDTVSMQRSSPPPLSPDTPLHISMLQDLADAASGWENRLHNYTNHEHQQQRHPHANIPRRSEPFKEFIHCTKEMDDSTIDLLWDTLLGEQHNFNIAAPVA